VLGHSLLLLTVYRERSLNQHLVVRDRALHLLLPETDLAHLRDVRTVQAAVRPLAGVHRVLDRDRVHRAEEILAMVPRLPASSSTWTRVSMLATSLGIRRSEI